MLAYYSTREVDRGLGACVQNLIKSDVLLEKVYGEDLCVPNILAGGWWVAKKKIKITKGSL